MLSLAKSLARFIAILSISPFLLTHFLCSLFSTPDRSLESHAQILSLFPGNAGSYLRVAFYRFTLKKCHPTATITFGVLFSKVEAEIHRQVYIGPRCILGTVTLEEDVLLGPMVQIPSGPHTHGIDRLDIPIHDQPGDLNRVTIGRDSWIGGSAIILADVGEQSVIAAGTIVTKSVTPRSIMVGNPARCIRQRGDASSE